MAIDLTENNALDKKLPLRHTSITKKIITAINITQNQLKISPICKTKLSTFLVIGKCLS